MIFQSLTYATFLVIVLAIYWPLRQPLQNWLLIPASIIFYGWSQPWFLIPFAATTLIDFFVARAIEQYPDRRKVLIGISLASNLGLLGVFKYYNFFIANLSALLDSANLHVPLPVLSVVLPAGISFYTFQSIAYVVDVARGEVPACRSFRDYALFVAFFPQLVAGPIQRPAKLLGQIQRRRSVTPVAVTEAIYLLFWGLFKKLVIADNVAITADKVFSLESPSFPILWTGVFAFCIQIFADFSAYTDIARASARLLGFELSQNFNHPYLATSPSDFWRRWHISLSTWIRDYIYIPLGGSRGGERRTMINLTIVFLLTGLWHGASWNFVIWGLYYAVLTILYRLAAAWVPQRLQTFHGVKCLQILLMFVLTNVGWLIFREQNIEQLWRDFTLNPSAAPYSDWRVAAYLAVSVGIYSLPLAIHTIWDTRVRESLNRQSKWPAFEWAAGACLVTLLFIGILTLRSDTTQDFIYFQF
jgi:D-alanyl-lipoteichoic acid acyltransferase DltB (MBOAT superfamily)